MSYVDNNHQHIDVTVQGEEDKPRRFDAVFNSAPLGAMQQMGLEGLKLNWGTKQAIRSLGYGASCKIGVRFRSLWWIHKLGIRDGGQAKTDLPIRCCVYPSYNMHDPPEQPGVLFVSYTWSQEAERIGALISRESPDKEEALKRVVLHDLARLHSSTDAAYEDLKHTITAEYLDHYAYNWYADPTSVGAFAYFGPGQFQKMYPSIVQSHGKHVIIGEAASSHHAWVVGALESAVRGVYQFLWQHSRVSEAAHRAAEDYAADRVPMPFGPVPAEYDRTQDIRVPDGVDDAAVPSPRGELARQQAMMEEIRLKQGGDFLDPSIVSERDVAPILAVVSA
ncbi:amino-acid oxidase [Apiospora hydei]|uniref:Amino-acid oxidase n=1 Tax=Apiospora hydei TaxID=1337664 RepID=A0ABR1WYV8_9PEZI